MEKTSEIYLSYLHMEWADAVVWKSVLEHPDAENDSKIRGLFYHIHSVQRAFYYLWTNSPLNFPKDSDFKDIKEIAVWGSEHYPNLFNYLDSINEEDNTKIIQIPWSKRVENLLGKKIDNTTLLETLLQVVSHSTYHRGQINMRFRELHGQPQLVDFIAWIWYGKPKANWKNITSDLT